MILLLFLLLLPPWNHRAVTPQTTAVYAVWADTGEPITAYNEKLPLNPASNIKLITSYCALKELKPNFRFATKFYTDTPLQNGEINNLWVKGEGDPSMVNESLLAMVQNLKNFGLRKINGDIYIDASYFDAQDYPGRQDNNERAYNATTSATSLNFNSVEVQIDGKQAHLLPETPYLKLNNRLKIGGKRAQVMMSTQPGKGIEIVTVSGRIPARAAPFSLYRNIYRPPDFFGHSLMAIFQQEGIRVTGRVKMGTAEGKTLFWKWESKPLHEIVRDMNKFSNNFIAEQLTKFLGAKELGAPGTTDKGVEVFKNCLAKMGVDTKNLSLENGSGLSYNNQATAEQLVKVLSAGFRDPQLREDFISSLSVGGVDGTMKRRHLPKELEGVLRAKTGSLNGISTLAGFVPAEKGRFIAFAILMNKTKGNLQELHRIQDAIVLDWIRLREDR